MTASLPDVERTISASRFKAQCLALLDEVAESGQALVVTKRGKPVARVEPPAGIQTLAAEVRAWGASLPERFESVHQPFDEQLMRDAEVMFRSFGPNQMDAVLLHGDVRLETFLLDGDHAVAIDPKPLAGEPAFDVAALLRDGPAELVRDPAAGRQRLQGRLEQLTDLLDVRAGRVRGWAFAVAVDTGLYAYETGDADGGDLMIEVARLCQSLSA